ncbi:hypothetical protein COSO111634_27435 [Corallococcus soli]
MGDGVAVVDEDGVGHAVLADVLAWDELLHQVLERHVRAGLRVRHLLAHALQQLAEGRVPREAGAERRRVRHVADERQQLRARAVGDGRPDDDVRLPRVAVQQRVPRRQHCHVAGEALALAEGHQLPGERLRERHVHALRRQRALLRARAVRGHAQLARHAREPGAPPLLLLRHQVFGERAALPRAEVRVLHAQGRQRGRLALEEGPVDLAQLVDEDRDGQRVADDVVDADEQQAHVLRLPQQRGAQDGAVHQVEGTRRVLAGEAPGFGFALLGRAGELHALQRDAHVRVEALHGTAVHLVIGGPQRFVAADDLLDGALQRLLRRLALQLEDDGDVVGGQAGQVLLQAPHALLHEGQGQLARAGQGLQRQLARLHGRGGLLQHRLDARGDARHGGRFEQGRQGHLDAERVTQLVEQLRGHQRVAANLQEVVVAADEVQRQPFAPERGHALLDVASRGIRARGGPRGFSGRRHGDPGQGRRLWGLGHGGRLGDPGPRGRVRRRRGERSLRGRGDRHHGRRRLRGDGLSARCAGRRRHGRGGARGVHPDALALERVGGQVDPQPLLVGVERLPVQEEPGGPQLAQRREQARVLRRGAAAPHRGHRLHAVLVLAEARAHQRGEVLAGPYLQQHAASLLQQRPHGVREAHRLAHLVRPVARRRQLARTGPGAGEAGDVAHRRLGAGQRAHDPGQLRHQRLHVR